MSEVQRGRELSDRIGEASSNWEPVLQRHGAEAPWHEVLSQVIAVIGDKAEDVLFVDAEVSNERRVSALTLKLVVFTRDLVLLSTLAAGGQPELAVLSRASLSGLVVREAPIVTFTDSNPQWPRLRVDLTYPRAEFSLPLDFESIDRTAELGTLLPGLASDLGARG
jgi:hypothetical protein